jgi:glycosyltransferase involved in cell wall biosynthesis
LSFEAEHLMPPDLTIAICAFNAAGRLEPTMRALGKLPRETPWELLLVDNASTDGTADTARNLATEMSLPLRIIHEPRKGKIFALRNALREAAAPVFTILDDDNVVHENWIEICLSFLNENPRAGIIGPRIDPIFEDPSSIPVDFNERYAQALAVRDLGPQPLRLMPPEHDGPPGAGMTGRTALFRTILFDVSCRLVGRVGKRLSGGEDSETALVAHRLGWELWYVPSLRLGHILPPGRLNEAYLYRLIVGGSRSAPWLDYLRGRKPQRSRAHYVKEWALLMSTSLKMAVIRAFRRESAEKFRFWADLYRSLAMGNLELARDYPFARFESSIESAAATAGPRAPAAAPAHAEAASC